MLTNWYEATVAFVLMAGVAVVLAVVMCAALIVWFKLNPPKGNRPSSYPGPR